MTQKRLINGDLLGFNPPGHLVKTLESRNRGAYVHRIADAKGGELNTDFFGVRITKMPLLDGHRANPVELFNFWLKNFNSFVDSDFAVFTPLPADQALWASPNPVGTVISIRMGLALNPADVALANDSGSVVVSERTDTTIRFTTINTVADHSHPVSGTREFGIRPLSDGTWILYTRGADAPTGRLDAIATPLVFHGADSLWKSLQDKWKLSIEGLSGSASEKVTIIQRTPIKDVEVGPVESVPISRLLKMIQAGTATELSDVALGQQQRGPDQKREIEAPEVKKDTAPQIKHKGVEL